MEYKKVVRNNVTLHLINSNRFKSINVILFFTKKFDKNDIKYAGMLTDNLAYSTKKYNTKNKLAIKGEELFGAKVGVSFGQNGIRESFIFSLDFVNPKYTDNKYFDYSLDFLSEVVFNPNASNNKFSESMFNVVKNDTIAKINAIKDNPNIYASIEYQKTMFKNTQFEYSSYPTLEDVNNINPSSLYSFYKSLFNGSYKIDIAAIGEIDESIIDKLFNIFGNIKSSSKKIKMISGIKYKDKEVVKIDTLPYNQSKLYMGYRLNNLTYHEMMHVLRVYNTILGTMNDSLLFNIVREENSLCYSISSYYSKYTESLTIYAGINKKNYEKTVELIKECVNLMSDKKTVEYLFDYAKKTINTFLNSYYDDVVAQVNTYYLKEFESIENIEELRENINKVTIDEVIKLNEKIKLSTIYMLKGDLSND